MKPTRTHRNRVTPADEEHMREALRLARAAADLGETPVGAVIVVAGQIVSRGHNRVEIDKDPTAHAEIAALRQAASRSGDWRLLDADVYVTLEPCIMCTAALLHARVRRVAFGAHDERWGALGTLFDLSHDPRLNHELEVLPGVLAEESTALLRIFFESLRQ